MGDAELAALKFQATRICAALRSHFPSMGAMTRDEFVGMLPAGQQLQLAEPAGRFFDEREHTCPFERAQPLHIARRATAPLARVKTHGWAESARRVVRRPRPRRRHRERA
eukprot:5932220-Prymnesium_polylepis.1